MSELRVALDTNLVAYETPRRVITGSVSQRGGKIVVLPTVRESAIRRLRSEEATYWDRKTMEERFDSNTAMRITAACEDAVQGWFEDLIRSHNGPYEAIEHDWQTRQQARRIGRNLPDKSVKKGRRGELEDRDILGEAIVEQVTLLTTHNLESISHERINEWLKNILKARSRAMLVDPDECMKTLRDEYGLDLYLATLQYVLREQEATENKWRVEYLKGLRRCAGSGLAWLAKTAKWEYDLDEDFPNRIVAAMSGSMEGYVQEAEKRRFRARMNAARQAGYDR